MDRAKESSSLVIDTWMAPDYWPEFQCLMGACRQTCCGGWRIRFSRQDYLNIKHAEKPPEVAAKLRGAMRRTDGRRGELQYAEFVLNEQGGCQLFREDGLCDLQCACGAETLPFVCRSFPRLEEYWTMGQMQKGCSTGCEAVLHALWDRREAGLGFVDGPLEPSERRRLTSKLQPGLCREYPHIWELCIDTLQDRRHPLAARILAVGLLTRRLADHAREEHGAWQGWAEAQRDALEGVYPELAAMPGNKTWFVGCNIKWLGFFLPTRTNNLTWCRAILKRLEGNPVEDYLALEAEFSQRFGNLEDFFENILVNEYFLYGLPFGNQAPDNGWDAYLKHCTTYSLLRFCAVAARPQDKLELIDILTSVSRALYHDFTMMNSFVRDLEQNKCDTLAAAAILVGG